MSLRDPQASIHIKLTSKTGLAILRTNYKGKDLVSLVRTYRRLESSDGKDIWRPWKGLQLPIQAVDALCQALLDIKSIDLPESPDPILELPPPREDFSYLDDPVK